MEGNPAKGEPKDFKHFPGKMDHVTLIAICVALMPEEHDILKMTKSQIIRKNFHQFMSSLSSTPNFKLILQTVETSE